MKKFPAKIFPYLFSGLMVLCVSFISPPGSDREKRILNTFHSYMEKQSAVMLVALDNFRKTVAGASDISIQKKAFLELRKSYKKMEAFSCYFFLASERNFNGPVVSEIEDESEDSPLVEYPHGLQQMEEYLWEEHPELFRKNLLDEIALMNENLSALHIAFQTLPADEVKFIEAVQLEVIRVFTLGISQFDTPLSKNAMEESGTAMRSLLDVVSDAYHDEMNAAPVTEVLAQLKKSATFFNSIPTPDSLDFLSCYSEYYIPLAKALAALRTGFTEANYFPSSALRMGASSVFDAASFNRFFYNPRGTDPEFSGEAAALGKALFFDPILSENNKRACASCHRPERAFTDGMKTSSGFLEGEMLSRNAPTIINAALQRNYFFDMRADHLEGQIGHVLTNKNEMQSSFESAVRKLNLSTEYVSWFKRAFKGKEDTLISKTSIENAISEYERTLVSLNSKFDRNVRGEENTFTGEEKSGLNVFMNKGRCATCHYLPLFNNVVPPYYTKSEFEIIGTPASDDLSSPKPDPDKGRGGLYGTKIFMQAFKTPTLRNIALTAPYMHNGAFRDLDHVIDFYNKGGGYGIGLNVPNQTLSSDSLMLSEKEKKNLVAFLNTLTDTAGLTSAPVRLPVFRDAALNKRKIGGEY